MPSLSPISSSPISDLGTLYVNETVSVSGFGATSFLGDESYTSQNYIAVAGLSTTADIGSEVVVATALTAATPVSAATGLTGAVTLAEGHGVVVTGVETTAGLGGEEGTGAESNTSVSGVYATTYFNGNVVSIAKAVAEPTGVEADGVTKYTVVWGIVDNLAADIWTEITG